MFTVDNALLKSDGSAEAGAQTLRPLRDALKIFRADAPYRLE
jgi:hypothetical protein